MQYCVSPTHTIGEFVRAHGASEVSRLPDDVEPFVQAWVRERVSGKSSARARKKAGQGVRNPIRQMLRLAIPGYVALGRPHKPDPFERQAPRFLTHLAEETGLRPRSILQLPLSPAREGVIDSVRGLSIAYRHRRSDEGIVDCAQQFQCRVRSTTSCL